MGISEGQNWGKVVRYLPLTKSFSFWGFLCLCQFWWKLIKKCDRESAHKWTHRLTDANQFYNLPHAIPVCYSYGTDKKIVNTEVMNSCLSYCYRIWCLLRHSSNTREKPQFRSPGHFRGKTINSTGTEITNFRGFLRLKKCLLRVFHDCAGWSHHKLSSREVQL